MHITALDNVAVSSVKSQMKMMPPFTFDLALKILVKSLQLVRTAVFHSSFICITCFADLQVFIFSGMFWVCTLTCFVDLAGAAAVTVVCCR